MAYVYIYIDTYFIYYIIYDNIYIYNIILYNIISLRHQDDPRCARNCRILKKPGQYQDLMVLASTGMNEVQQTRPFLLWRNLTHN